MGAGFQIGDSNGTEDFGGENSLWASVQVLESAGGHSSRGRADGDVGKMIRLTVAGGVAEGDPLWLRAEEILAITMEHGTPNPSTVVILNGLKFDVKETVDEVVALVKGA